MTKKPDLTVVGKDHNGSPTPIVKTDHLDKTIADLEKLMASKQVLTDKISDRFERAKNDGLDKKVLRRILRIRATPQEDYKREDYIFNVYKSHLGMQTSLELEPKKDDK